MLYHFQFDHFLFLENLYSNLIFHLSMDMLKFLLKLYYFDHQDLIMEENQEIEMNDSNELDNEYHLLMAMKLILNQLNLMNQLM